MTNLVSILKTETLLWWQRSSQSYGFSSSHVWMGELDHKESWVPKNWCFWIVVLEKILESPFDCKKIKPVNTKGNQPWVFIGRTDPEGEASILWHSAFFVVQLSHPYVTTRKTIAVTRWTFVGKVMSLLFNLLSRFVMLFFTRSKHLLISWLQSPSAVMKLKDACFLWKKAWQT